jgi:hypothetical protein
MDSLLVEGERIAISYSFDGGVFRSTFSEIEIRSFVTLSSVLISSVSGKDSEYYRQLPQTESIFLSSCIDTTPNNNQVGVFRALKIAVDRGLLVALEQRIRTNVYVDFLEQSRELVASHYHVAAMVLVGGVLEDRLRKICIGRVLTWKGSGSLAKYNDLLKDVLYDQATWRRVQAIGDVRNDAAHGNGANVKEADVDDALKYVERFLADYPA